MKILIIGSKGFIGTHAVEYFRAIGHEIYGCDIVTSYDDNNYFIIDASNSNFHLVFRELDYDVCINCSGAASVQDSLTNPFRDYTLNTANVFKMLEAIKLFQPKCKFINLSSAAVYGNPEVLPIKENSPLSPLSPYGLHKLYAEKICKEFYSFFGIQTCSLRIFSAYGEGLKKQLFWDLFRKINLSNKIELFGTGEETRDFIYIQDLISAIDCVINKHPFTGDEVNLANGEEITISEAAFTFASFFNKEIEISFNKIVKKGDPINWKADISNIKSLGYIKKFSFKEGLNAYYEWCKSK